MRRALLVFGLTMTLAVFQLPLAAAATPSSGTLSPTNPAVTYTGGPYLVPNDSNFALDPICAPPALQCDDFSLTVQADAAFAAANNVQFKVQWPDPTADFDLYVYDSTGREATRSATGADPEIAVMPTVPDVYLVRIIPFLPLGQTFTTTITFVPRPPPPPPAPVTQNYHNYPAPAGQAESAGEPSIGVNWATDHSFFQSGSRTYRVSFDGATPLPNATWVEKSARLTKCDVQTGFDPIGFVDNTTGRVFSSELLVNPVVNSLTCFSSDEGESWTPSEGGGVGQGIDHQTIGGGPYKAGAPGGPTTAYPHAVYYCSQMLLNAQCSRSDDGGQLFSPAVTIYNGECVGIHGHVKVAPNGTVWVPNRSCGGRAGAAVSFTNGTTWVVRSIPGSSAGDSDPSIGISSGNVVYLGYVASDHHAHIAVSRDEGATWLNDTDVGAIANVQNVVFPAVAAGDDDRAAYAFLGSTTAGDPEAADFAGTWQVYVAHTYDGGKTWTLASVDTPADPVQRGCIWLSGGDNPCRNLLDFIGADIDSHGVVLVAYADGCTDPDNDPATADCVNTAQPSDSTPGYRVEHGTIARQIGGKGLFARFDPPQPDLAITNIAASQARPKVVTLTATVANTGSAAASGVIVRFFDGSVKIGDTAPITVGAGGTASVSLAWSGAKNGDHSITAIVDPDNLIAEKNETNNSAKRLINIQGSKLQGG